MLGQSGSGKTKFLNHLRIEKFKNYCPTIGVDYIVYKDPCGVKLQIWDTSGSDRFKAVVNNFLKGIDLCIFVYKDESSFRAMMNLISHVKNEEYGKRYCILSFDLPQLGKQVASKYGFFFFKVNIEEKKECLQMLEELCSLCVKEQNKCNFLKLNLEGKFEVEKTRDSGFCWFSFC